MWKSLQSTIELIAQCVGIIAIIAGINWKKTDILSWWQQMRKRNDDFVCYAIFLTFPADIEANKYINDSWKEIDIISGNECMVISFQRGSIRVPQETGFKISNSNHDWRKSIKDNIDYGSVFAEIFGIKLTEFPCILIFKNLDSSEYALVSLKGMSSEEIAMRMREVFSIIRKAASKSTNPIIALNRDVRRNIVSTAVRKIGEKTLRIAFEGFFNSIKS